MIHLVGGKQNCITEDCNFIGGGEDNKLVTNSLSAIVGGFSNCNTSLAGFIGGGARNTGSGNYGVIAGGEKNSVSGTCSGILGGNDNTVTHNDSFIVGSDLSSKAACHTFVNNLDVTTNACITGSLTVNTNITVNGNTTLGNAATDTVTINADIASCLVPSTTTLDLGTATDQWRNLYIDGTANIDCLSADSADINGGTIDGTTIGQSTCAAGTFTSLNASSLATTGNVTVGGNLTVSGDLAYMNVTNLAIEDRFILLNSGSLGEANPEGGIVVDSGGGIGPALFYDNNDARWGFTSSFNAATTGSGVNGIAPDAYAAAVVTSDILAYQKVGNIRVEGGEAYIYV